ncbi:hypothetical protein [Halomonas sp. GD1P12]|uniref:hypothetical protein n=1 Tax=Halomonas sp. GD1P12 TaxID=2982691 RepID=UPI0021E4F996|nr:hypothetical protein [Halomonas sp. GD1P12]UYF98865.1 hypothetical protein OCT39_11570 [Halomonas sp. GD1P12]
MKPIVIVTGLLACSTTAAFAQDHMDSGLAYFQDYCLKPGGKLEKSIDLFSNSDTFGNERSMGSDFTYVSYTGPDGINASVLIGASFTDDKCTIIMTGVDEPMVQSEALAATLTETAGAEFMEWEAFEDYGNGGFGYRDAQGDVVVAPVTTGISDDIVHLSFYPN